MLTSVDELIKAVGGNAAAASMVGVKPAAVSNWKARGAIPAEHFMIFAGFFAGDGRTFDPSLFGFKEAAE